MSDEEIYPDQQLEGNYHDDVGVLEVRNPDNSDAWILGTAVSLER